MPLSDEEVICSFMEDREVLLQEIRVWVDRNKGGVVLASGYPRPKWWKWTERPEPTVIPLPLTLNELHEVEARLIGCQWDRYSDALIRAQPDKCWPINLAHSDATTRIKALAAVLRSEVEER